MSLNVGRAIDLIEYFCKNVDPEITSNHELVRQILNMKLRDFADRTGILETKSTISSVADQQEYELPADCLHISKVVYDDYKAAKITFDQIEELLGNV